MKTRIFWICVGLFFSSSAAMAQYAKGDKLWNIGIGLNSYYNGGIPLNTSFEVGVTDEISVGAELDYLSYRYNFAGTRYGFTSFYLAGRGSYHFNKLLNLKEDALDIYAGAGLGFRSFSWNESNNFSGLGNVYGNGAFLAIHVGTRYYFSDKIGAYLELGAGGASNATLGLAFKF